MNTETLTPVEFHERSQAPSELMVALSAKFAERGIQTARVPGDEIYTDPQLLCIKDILVCAPQFEEDSQPRVRVYRGISEYNSGTDNLGEQVFSQRPYALKKPTPRSNSAFTRSTELASSEAHEDIAKFLDTGRFTDLVEAFRQADLSDYDRKFIENSRLKDMATSLINYPGRTLRQELAFHHVAAPSGTPTQDVSPFVATSLAPGKAMRHGNVMLVLDVPVSVVEGYGEEDEVLVGLAIEPEWISAVVEHDPRPGADVGELVARRLGMTEVQEASQREVVEQVIDGHSKKDALLIEQNVADAHKYLIERICNIFGNEADDMERLIAEHNITDYREASKLAGNYIRDQKEALGLYAARFPFKEPLSEEYLSDMYESVQAVRKHAA